MLTSYDHFCFCTSASALPPNRSMVPSANSAPCTLLSDSVTQNPFAKVIHRASCIISYIHIMVAQGETDRTGRLMDRVPASGVMLKTLLSVFHQQCYLTKSRNSTVTNLQIGTEYCVWVSTEININRNTMPSAVECTFTGKEEPGRGKPHFQTESRMKRS